MYAINVIKAESGPIFCGKFSRDSKYRKLDFKKYYQFKNSKSAIKKHK